jgi:diguanylate cyclase (GGDEF)-like protein
LAKKPVRSIKLLTLFIAVSAVIVGSVFLIGHFSMRQLLNDDAQRRAELWYDQALANADNDLDLLVERVRTDTAAGNLGIAGIDALVLIRRNGTVEQIHGPEGAEKSFMEATARSTGEDVPIDAEARTFSRKSFSLFSIADYSIWSLLPAKGDFPGRIAVRVSQAESAGILAFSFKQQLSYYAGFATVTFFSFMAGFTYRTKREQEQNREMRYLAHHDGLTSLPNRAQFEETLERAATSAVDNGHKLAVIILDLDGFKAVNDTLGHPIGDGLLKAAGERLQASLRDNDLLARLSGDEFAIIVPKMTDPSSVNAMAKRIIELISSPFQIEGHEIMVGCSMGIAIGPDNGDTADKLVRNADFALYRAKSEGKRTWRFFDPKMAEDMKSRRTLEDGLRYALKNDLFTLLYQPQYDLESDRVIGYEALLRWRLPGKGLVPTSMFLSIAEETGLIIPMGEWVIRQAARDGRLLPENMRIAINLSAAQLKRDGIEVFIAHMLRDYGISPERVDIEVNESILGRGESSAFMRLEKIRETGISIVMDNFGVGTSSLGLLSRYPFDKIKVDRSFMNGIDGDHKTRAVVAAICNLGRSLGMSVAGEGVETAEHAAILKAAGCNQAQGFHFGHPKPLEDILRDNLPRDPRIDSEVADSA